MFTYFIINKLTADIHIYLEQTKCGTRDVNMSSSLKIKVASWIMQCTTPTLHTTHRNRNYNYQTDFDWALVIMLFTYFDHYHSVVLLWYSLNKCTSHKCFAFLATILKHQQPQDISVHLHSKHYVTRIK